MIASVDFLKISHVKKRAFLAAFSRCGSLSRAAKRAKVDRRTHYNWLKDDPWYVQAFQQAVIEAGDSLQDRLTEMAFDGNVTAAIFLLKGLKPQTFRDRVEQTNLLKVDPKSLTKAQLDVLADHLLGEALGTDDPTQIEAARKQLEAGPPVIETTAALVDESTAVEPQSTQ